MKYQDKTPLNNEYIFKKMKGRKIKQVLSKGRIEG
jgi:hypothetical protein